jgi:cob(I)alamin adenosyltransferase
MIMKIYTKTGDKGTTRLVDGRECSKSDLRVETYGTVDELNSSLGVAISQMNADAKAQTTYQPLIKELTVLQNQLFTVGSHLACSKEETRKLLPAFSAEWITDLEKQIDAHTATLPPLKAFILPGGSIAASELHVARTVCRRAERMVVRLIEDSNDSTQVLETSLRYLNRLSDYLFTVARVANKVLQVPDQEWQKL